jgi:hypothetical protein
VVADHQVDLSRVDDPGDMIDQLVVKLLLDGVDQNDLLIKDQESIVGGPQVRGISVEIPDIPIGRSDLVNIWRYHHRIHTYRVSVPLKGHKAESIGHRVKSYMALAGLPVDPLAGYPLCPMPFAPAL